jgi:hypothetical protein
VISFKSQQLVRALFVDDGDLTIDCADVLEQIARVATADESTWTAEYPALYQHVTACGHCAAVYGDLQWILGQATAQTLAEPARYPPVDLSFLPDPLARLWQRAGHVANQGYFWIRNTQGAVWLSLAHYLQVRPLHTALKHPAPDEHLVHLACEPDENLAIELIADAAADEQVTITAHIRQPDRFHQGYDGTKVSLHFGNDHRTGQTNDAGRIVFSQIPARALPELVVQVTPFDCPQ